MQTYRGPDSWSFKDIESVDPARAAALKAAGSPDQLIVALCAALEDGFDGNDVRFGFERAEGRREDRRAVVQFAVGERLFDWMFNARTGYRAHFRADAETGLAFNDRIVEALAGVLANRLPNPVSCVDISERFDDCGRINVARRKFLASLAIEGSLPKVWFCTRRICKQGGVKCLSLGLGGPKLSVGNEIEWAAPAPDDDNAWLDIKGAFWREDGPYQPKDPLCRAHILASSGGA